VFETVTVADPLAPGTIPLALNTVVGFATRSTVPVEKAPGGQRGQADEQRDECAPAPAPGADSSRRRRCHALPVPSDPGTSGAAPGRFAPATPPSGRGSRGAPTVTPFVGI
jgi:hypothetical protein